MNRRLATIIITSVCGVAMITGLGLAFAGESEPSTDEPTTTGFPVNFSGETKVERYAEELGLGCTGFTSVAPSEVVTLVRETDLEVSATSEDGPIAVGVVGSDGRARCSPNPSTQAILQATLGPGRHEIYVLSAGERTTRSFDATVQATEAGKQERRDAQRLLSVSVTSEPLGAEVIGPDGESIGLTPTMFVRPLDPRDTDPVPLTLRLDGYEEVQTEVQTHSLEASRHLELKRADGGLIGTHTCRLGRRASGQRCKVAAAQGTSFNFRTQNRWYKLRGALHKVEDGFAFDGRVSWGYGGRTSRSAKGLLRPTKRGFEGKLSVADPTYKTNPYDYFRRYVKPRFDGTVVIELSN
jgi:hypothetical protein